MARLSALVCRSAIALCFTIAIACGGASTTNVAKATDTRCVLAVSGSASVIENAGGSGRLAVSVNRECTWTARAEVAWISLAPTEGQGSGEISYTVSANSTAAERKGAVVINEQRVELTQAAACVITIAPAQAAVGAEGGSLALTVAAPDRCAWTAASHAPWITIASGTAGTGGGGIALAIASNAGPGRTGTVEVAGQTLTVTQAPAGTDGTPAPAPAPAPAPPPPAPAPSPTPAPAPAPAPAPTPPPTPVPRDPTCVFTLSRTSETMPAQGATASVTVTTSGSCAWESVSNFPWLTIVAGASGSGSGSVQFAAAANASQSARSGTLTIAGQTFTVTQAGVPAPPTCNVTVASSSLDVPAGGGTRSVAISAPSGCAWTAASHATWLSITSGASGTGNGTLQFTATTNPSPATRLGTLTVEGQTITVSQPGTPITCTFTVAPATVAAPVGGGPGSVTVTASDASCAWTAASGAAEWLTITSGSGPGSGVVQYTVAANPGPEGRSGTLTVAGQTVVVNQAGPPAVVSVTGVVAGLQGQCPSITFTLGAQLVRTDASSQFQRGNCSGVTNGGTVTAQGTIQSDGSLLAGVVRRED